MKETIIALCVVHAVGILLVTGAHLYEVANRKRHEPLFTREDVFTFIVAFTPLLNFLLFTWYVSTIMEDRRNGTRH